MGQLNCKEETNCLGKKFEPLIPPPLTRCGSSQTCVYHSNIEFNDCRTDFYKCIDNKLIEPPRPPTFEPTKNPIYTNVPYIKQIDELDQEPVPYKLGYYINSEVSIMHLSMIVSAVVLFIVGSICVYRKCKHSSPPVQDSGSETSEKDTCEDIQDHEVSSTVNPAIAQVMKEV